MRLLQFEQATGVTLKHVPYRGAPPIVVDLISGDVPVSFQNIPNVSAPLSTGQVEALAVTTKKRSKVLPNVPTMHEEGLKGFESYRVVRIARTEGNTAGDRRAT